MCGYAPRLRGAGATSTLRGRANSRRPGRASGAAREDVGHAGRPTRRRCPRLVPGPLLNRGGRRHRASGPAPALARAGSRPLAASERAGHRVTVAQCCAVQPDCITAQRSAAQRRRAEQPSIEQRSREPAILKFSTEAGFLLCRNESSAAHRSAATAQHRPGRPGAAQQRQRSTAPVAVVWRSASAAQTSTARSPSSAPRTTAQQPRAQHGAAQGGRGRGRAGRRRGRQARTQRRPVALPESRPPPSPTRIAGIQTTTRLG